MRTVSAPSPTAEQHPRFGMIIQLSRLCLGMAVEQLHSLTTCISASISQARRSPEPASRGSWGIARSCRPGRPTPAPFLPGNRGGEDGPRRRHPGLRERAAGTGSGGGPGRGPGARGSGETRTYPRRAAGGRGQPSPGGDEVGRRGSPAPADEGEQGPQEEGGRGAAQVEAEPEQDGARPRASGRLPATGPQAGEAHGGECGHGHRHSPAPAARSPRCRRVFPGVRPQLARGARDTAAAGGCGRREVEAGAAAVGGIGVHAASCAAKDRHISCPAVPRRCPGRWPLRGASSPRRSRRRRS